MIKEQKVKIINEEERLCKVLVSCEIDDVKLIDGKRVYVVPDGVEVIGYEAFDSKYVDTVILPNSLLKIEGRAFASSSLVSVEIPDSVIYIGDGAFWANLRLQSVKLPPGLSDIPNRCFKQCGRLKEVDFPTNLNTIGNEAFCNTALESFTISKDIKRIGDGAFAQTPISRLTIEEHHGDIHKDAFRGADIKSIVYQDKVYTLKNFDNIKCHLDRHINNILRLQKLEALSERVASKKYKLQHDFAIKLVEAGQDEEFGAGYFKLYNQLIEMYFSKGEKSETFTAFQTLCYNLGIFNKSLAQRPAEFLKQANVEGKLVGRNILSYFKSMKLEGYKADFNEFLCNRINFDKLIALCEVQPDIISRIYNSFEETQKYNLSANSQHRQLKPTVEAFERYFQESAFTGVTEETKPIAKELSKFSQIKQESFDRAVSIWREYNQMIKTTGYKDESIIEEDVFTRIEYYNAQITQDLVDTATMLNDLANKDFTYEWLAKNDPRNFVLGYYCNCCSFIGGAGEGIVKASIVLPNLHNLVIKNKQGDIRAKATLYVNEEQGYGVINNFEVHNDYLANQNNSKDENEFHESLQVKIMNKFKHGVERFVEKYNNEHKIPIDIITVGMNNNDLFKILDNYPKPRQILQAIDYSKYAPGNTHPGDWDRGQWIFWSNERGKELWQEQNNLYR